MNQSGMSIAALILSILGCTFIIGVILAIIDLAKKDTTKKHTLSIVALVISGVWLVGGIANMSLGNKEENTPTIAVEETKIDNSNEEIIISESENNIADAAEETIIKDETQDISSSAETLPTVGQSVENEEWKITLTGAKQYDSIPDEYYTDTPEDGKIYLVLFFEAENVSKKDDYLNYFYFEAYEDGYNTSFSVVMNKPDGYPTFTGDVASGKKLKGCLVYEVSPNWEEFEISYKEWILTSGKIATFKVTPSNLSN